MKKIIFFIALPLILLTSCMESLDESLLKTSAERTLYGTVTDSGYVFYRHGSTEPIILGTNPSIDEINAVGNISLEMLNQMQENPGFSRYIKTEKSNSFRIDIFESTVLYLILIVLTLVMIGFILEMID
ncbi:hypothetical protein H6776_02270 [Candidatus Nomurabacteria bacterium]|nr:hypothetical protein [Candidatus Nomurabacteria bacterium]